MLISEVRRGLVRWISFGKGRERDRGFAWMLYREALMSS